MLTEKFTENKKYDFILYEIKTNFYIFLYGSFT